MRLGFLGVRNPCNVEIEFYGTLTHTRIHLPYTVRTRETCVSVRCAVTLYMTILQVAKREKRMKYTHSRESMNQSVLAAMLAVFFSL